MSGWQAHCIDLDAIYLATVAIASGLLYNWQDTNGDAHGLGVPGALSVPVMLVS